MFLVTSSPPTLLLAMADTKGDTRPDSRRAESVRTDRRSLRTKFNEVVVVYCGKLWLGMIQKPERCKLSMQSLKEELLPVSTSGLGDAS